MTVSGFEPVLAALRRGAAGYFGDPAAIIEPVEQFDRPASMVVRLRVTTAARQLHAFAKVYKPREAKPYGKAYKSESKLVEDEFAATLRLYRAVDGRLGLSAPRPIACLPDQSAIVTEEVDGTPFDRLLRRAAWRRIGPPSLQTIATRIGGWLRAYQSAGTARGALSLDASRTYIDERLRHLVPRVLTAGDRVRALDLFDQLAADVRDGEPLVPIHADFFPGNILVTNDGNVRVLDFATAQSGTRYHDLAHLFMHLELGLRRPRLRRSFVRPVQRALIVAFEHPGTTGEPLFRLMLLQHVVCHVTQLAERSHRRFQPLTRQLIRRRFRGCLAMPAFRSPVWEPAARALEVPARPSNLPIR